MLRTFANLIATCSRGGSNQNSVRKQGKRRKRVRGLLLEGLEQRDLFAQLTWAVGPELPQARAGAAAVAASGNLLVVGGGTTTTNIWNPGTNVWGQAVAIDMPRVSAGAAPIANGYLVYGGQNGNALLEESLAYNPWNIDSTQDTTVMPTPSSDFAFASDDSGRAYAIGGRGDSTSALNRVLRYDSSSTSWQTVAALPTALAGAAALNDSSGHLLVFGGMDSAGHASNQVYQYTIADNTWTTLTSMPIAEHNGAAVLAANGRIYILGGASDTATLATVQAYDPVAATWSIETSLPQPLSHVAAGSDADGRIVVMGGYDSTRTAVKTVSVSQMMNAPDAAPAFTSTAPASVLVGANYTYNIKTTGNPQAVFQLIDAPSGMTVDAIGTITWTPTLAQAGLNTITVRATNVVGSADQTFSVRALTPAPTAPTNLTATTTTTTATLTWTPSTDSIGVAGYQVYRVTHTGFHGITTRYTQVADVPNNTATITGLSAGVSYVYVVKAYNASGNVSGASNSVSARTLSPISYTGPTTVPGVARHPVSFTLGAVANPNSFTYTNLTPTDGMTLNPTTGLVTWTPTDADVGANYFTYRIDHILGSVTVEVTINVTPNVPYSTFVAGPNAVADVPYTASFAQIADTYNTEPVTFALISAPAGMTIDSATGQINWTPTLADTASAATVTASISNYAGTTNNTATISVAFASAAQQVAISHISTTSATVSWEPPADAAQPIVGYAITASYRQQSGRFITTRVINFSALASDRSLSMTGLPANKSINVSVRALDATNRSGWAGTTTFTTASQLPNVTVAGGPFNYDGNPHGATAVATSTTGVPVAGTFSFTYNGLDTPPILPGSYTVRALFTSSDPVYGERIATGTLNILPGIPVVSVNNSAVNYDALSHGSTAIAFGVDGVTALAGNFTYTYDGSATEPTTPGIYNVVANFTSADPLYSNSSGTGTLTIRSVGSLAPTITLSHLSFDYDGQPHAPLAKATAADGTTIAGQFLITYNGTDAAPVNFGVYVVQARFISSDPNYHDEQLTGSMAIHKATPTADIGWLAYEGSGPVPTITYDGQSHIATANAIGVQGELVPGSFTFSYSPAAPTSAGSYLVTAELVSDDPNYANTTLTQSLVIEAAVPYVEITFPDPAQFAGYNYYYAVYNGTAWEASATAYDLVGSPLVGSTILTYYAYDPNTGDYSAALPGAPQAAGSYLVMAEFNSVDTNYAGTVGYGFLQVDAAVPQLSVAGTFSYDGQSHGAVVQALGVDGVTPVAGTYTVLYNGSGTRPTNAGSYSVSVTFTSSDPNYTDNVGDGVLVINKVTPVFSNLSVASATVGSNSAAVSGRLAAGTTYPSGGSVSITLNGTTITARVSNTGTFSASLAVASLAIGSYPVGFAYAGNANGFNAATTASSTLVITARAPAITTNPVARTVVAGATATFTAAASGNPTPTVQWQVSTDNGATFNNVAGATSTTLNVATTNTMNGYRYRAVFTNSAGTATTNAAILTVQYAPVITTNPTNQTATAGSTVRFTAAARANPAATVQWQVSSNGGTTWTNISGATNTTLSLTATTSLRGYRYRAVFTNAIGSTTTTAAVLTVP